VDWPDFLGRCDLRWDEGVRDTWGECAFIADGQTGASIYGLAGEPGALRWQFGRTDVTAHHRLPEDWCVPRVPIGDIIMRTPGRVIGSSMRLHLWDAEGCGPVIESPLSAVESINYMLLQSCGDVIRVFPAMPGRWRNATYENLRAEGGSLVSAQWREGKITWIRIHSLAGSPCRIETEMGDFQVEGLRHFLIRDLPCFGKRRRFPIDYEDGCCRRRSYE